MPSCIVSYKGASLRCAPLAVIKAQLRAQALAHESTENQRREGAERKLEEMQ